MAFAPDGLTSVGGYPGDDDKGGELFGKVDRTKMTEDFVAAAMWLKSAARLHRQDRRDRLLLRRRRGQHAGRAARPDLAAAAPFYGARADGGRRPEDQGGDPRSPRRARHAARGGVARLRQRRSRRPACLTKGTSIPARSTASTTTRRPSATTRRRPTSRGTGRSNGLTSTCGRATS